MQDFNTRIASRTDTKQNWELNNPILLQGEIAIVFDGNNQLFKVGDGQNHFNDLQYSFYDQFASEQINTSNLRAKSISQGYGSNVNGIGGIATGYKSQVSSNFAQSHGYQAKVSSDFGYVWNGDNTISNYSDHGNGSFNVNPKDGISGLYIGDRNLKEIIEQESPKPNTAGYGLNLNNGELSVDVTKIAQQSDISDFSKVTLISNDVVYSKDLSVVKISEEEYYKLVVNETTNPSVLYVVDYTYLNAYDQTIRNVASPELSDDAATKDYVDSEISKIPQPDLTQFYKKSETSSSAEIANAIKNNVQVSAALDSGTQIASISVDGVATPIYAPVSEGIYRYPLITAELSTINDQLCCLIQDHTITTIEVSSAETPLVVKLPPKPEDNGARDFILRIEVSSSTAPGVTFSGLDESITFDSDSEDWMAIEPGLNLISFTETK